MPSLVVGVVTFLLGLFGVLINFYVVLVLLHNKKARTSSEWILLHLGWCGFGSSLVTIIFIAPSLSFVTWMTSIKPVCSFIGSATIVIQLLMIWSICALSADRCAAIVSPLRYTQLVTGRKITAFFMLTWILCLVTMSAALFINKEGGFMENVMVGENETENINKRLSFTKRKGTSEYLHVNYSDDVYDVPSSFATRPERTVRSKGENLNLEYDFMKEEEHYDYQDVESSLGGEDLTISRESQDPSLEVNATKSNETMRTYSFNLYDQLGLCIPRIDVTSFWGALWSFEWLILILVAPLLVVLICDLVVLSIARKQRHRIIMALVSITLSAQATVTRTKGTATSSLWLNRTIPAKSRACRAVWEDIFALIFLHLPLLLIIITHAFESEHKAPSFLVYCGLFSLVTAPSCVALLYGTRARTLKAAYKSYVRKRLTNTTLQNEIQQRLSPVDGSPRASSRGRSPRSSSPSRSLSPSPATPFNGMSLRPPRWKVPLSSSPSHQNLGKMNGVNNSIISGRRVRSFLNIPSYDMQELWSGLRRPNRSPTIVITHELRSKGSNNSLFTSHDPSNAEQRI